MESAAPIDTKKAVCRTLTNVIKTSPLKEAIDPTAFFMMVSTNFPVLYSGTQLNLGPLWNVLAQQHAPDVLFGVFLKFQEAVDDLGVPVSLPDQVTRLTDEERVAVLQRFASEAAPADAPEEAEAAAPGQEEANALPTADFQLAIPEDLRRKVTMLVASAIRQAPVGAKLDVSALSFWMDSSFAAICDGQVFRFAPVRATIREQQGTTDAEIYPALVRLREPIEALGLAVEDGEWELDARERKRIEKSLKAVDPKRTKETDRESKESYTVAGPRDARRWKVIRPVIQGVLLLATLVGFILTRSTRGLDPHDFGGVKLTTARLDKGAFFGTLDETSWYKLDYAGRTRSLKALEQQLKDKGWLIGAQIRDGQDRLVMTGNGNRLSAAKVILEDRLAENDPTRPKPSDTPPLKGPKGH